MTEWTTPIIAGSTMAAGLGTAAYVVRAAGLRRRSRRRLGDGAPRPTPRVAPPAARSESSPIPPERLAVRRFPWAPWAAALIAGVTARLFGLNPLYCGAIGVMAELLGAQLESSWAQRQWATLDLQLADALDLMIGSLQAGGTAVMSLERVAGELRAPLGPQLHEVLARIRFGEGPPIVLRRMAARLPTESFRLFCTTLTVHFEVGGSLAPPLAVVGRIVRDRIDVGRRIRSLTAQARISTVVLLLTTYGIAILMWRKDPARMHAFLSSSVGTGMIAGSIVLQAVGVVWQGSISKARL